MNSKSITLILFLGMLLLSGSLSAADKDTQAVRITSQPLSALLYYPVYSAPATALTLHRSQLSAQINARIIRFPIKVGDVVDGGRVVAELDCRDNELALQRAQSNFKFAQQQLKRSLSLRKKQSVSEEVLNQRQNAFELAQLEMRQQTLQVSRCQVKAPFKGMVVERQAAEGSLASPGTPLLTLLDVERVEVSANVPLDQIDSLYRAEKIWFEAQEVDYPLQLRALLAEIDTRARNRELRLAFVEQRALPGSPGRLKWQGATPLLPAEYIVNRQNKLGVFVVENAQARFIPVEGALEGQAAPIKLLPATLIIIDGRFSLHHGEAVKEQ